MAGPRPSHPTVAVDLRALVPEATGIGVYTRELLRGLAGRGGFSYLGLAHREPRGAIDLAALGVRLEHQPSPLGVLWQQLSLPRRLARGRDRGEIDLLWSPLQTLPARCPVPAVVTVHDLTVLLMPEAHRSKVRWSQVPFLERSLVAARRVVAVSAATANDLRFHFPEAFRDPAKLRVIHHGVAPVFRPAVADERESIRRELGFPRGYLLYAGTLEPRKNVEGVLEAWLALRSSDPAAPALVLAGGYGWRSRPLMRRIEAVVRADVAAGRERSLAVLGRVAEGELARLYRAATVFVYPSFYEGFGMPVAEAMASGVPVITSDRSSLPEVAGEAALQVRPEDPAQVLGALVKLLANPALAQDLAQKGLERARTFRWEKAATEMEEVFREALE
ncbi:MAG TPA: glycosyltransferase family 1 protein [Thermoanaerobaculia bacterium]|nr:glycosyltransferase family 1 protein [Thermoanaerobaculia bacterium]